MRRAWFLGAALVCALAACGDDGGGGGGDDDDDDDDDTEERDAGGDAGRDAGGGMDSGLDGGRDSGTDAGRDGGGGDAGDGGGVVDAGRDGGVDATVTDAGPVTFAMVYSSILQPKCSSANCHDGDNPAAGLDFSSEGDAYDDLVGENAGGAMCDDMDFVRVEEENADESLLVLKVEANPPCGARMPAGGMPPLSANEIAMIRAWIDQGAEED